MADEICTNGSPSKAAAWESTEAHRRMINFGTPYLDSQSGARLVRAKAFGVKPTSETSFEANQSFPRYQKSKHEHNNFNSSRQKLPRVLKADDLHCISFASNVAEPPNSSCHSSIITSGVVSAVPSDSWFVHEDLDSESFRSHLIHPRKALLTVNLKTTKILTTNDIALELLHYTADDFERLSLDDLIVGEKGQPAIAETLLFGNRDSVIHSGKVVTVLRKNGTHLAMSLWLSRINQPDCEDVCIAALEPVERIIAQLDIDCEGRIVVGNGAAAALFHYDCDDLSGRHLTCLLPKAIIPPSKDAMKIQQTVGATYHGQYFPLSLQFKSPDEMVYDEENESIVEWVAHTAIITVYAHFSGLFIVNDDGQIVDVNSCFLLLAFGYDRQNVIGKNLADFMCPFDPKFATAAEFLHRDGSSVPVSYEMRKSCETVEGNRHCVWISCSLRHLQNWDESQSYFVSESSISGYNEMSLGHAVATKATTLRKTAPSHLIHSCNCSVSIDDDLAMTQGEYGSCYELVRDIGRGGFGCVKLAFRKSDRLLVVTKFLRKCRVSSSAFVKNKNFTNEQLPLEIHLLMTLKHPNIVTLLGVFENEAYYQIAMEKHGSGYDLFEFVERKPALDEPLASYIFRQLISAVDYLHSINIVHRDIKDENVIISHEFHIKLIDFGAAAYFEPGRKFTTFFGTEQFGCPEGLRGRGYSGPEAEVWALGVTLYVLMYEELPFGNVDESIAAVLQPPYDQSAELMALLHEMLRREPEERIRVPELKAHSWLNQAVDPSGYDFFEMMRQKPPSRDVSVFYQTPKRNKEVTCAFKVPVAATSTDVDPLVTSSCLLPVTSTPCRKQKDAREDESLSVAGDSFLTNPDFDDEGEV